MEFGIDLGGKYSYHYLFMMAVISKDEKYKGK